MAAVAQWIRPRFPSYRPGFESQAYHLRFYKFGKDENKLVLAIESGVRREAMQKLLLIIVTKLRSQRSPTAKLNSTKLAKPGLFLFIFVLFTWQI